MRGGNNVLPFARNAGKQPRCAAKEGRLREDSSLRVLFPPSCHHQPRRAMPCRRFIAEPHLSLLFATSTRCCCCILCHEGKVLGGLRHLEGPTRSPVCKHAQPQPRGVEQTAGHGIHSEEALLVYSPHPRIITSGLHRPSF